MSLCKTERDDRILSRTRFAELAFLSVAAATGCKISLTSSSGKGTLIHDEFCRGSQDQLSILRRHSCLGPDCRTWSEASGR